MLTWFLSRGLFLQEALVNGLTNTFWTKKQVILWCELWQWLRTLETQSVLEHAIEHPHFCTTRPRCSRSQELRKAGFSSACSAEIRPDLRWPRDSGAESEKVTATESAKFGCSSGAAVLSHVRDSNPETHSAQPWVTFAFILRWAYRRYYKISKLAGYK